MAVTILSIKITFGSIEVMLSDGDEFSVKSEIDIKCSNDWFKYIDQEVSHFEIHCNERMTIKFITDIGTFEISQLLTCL